MEEEYWPLLSTFNDADLISLAAAAALGSSTIISNSEVCPASSMSSGSVKVNPAATTIVLYHHKITK
jgi:hypothetical protein